MACCIRWYVQDGAGLVGLFYVYCLLISTGFGQYPPFEVKLVAVGVIGSRGVGAELFSDFYFIFGYFQCPCSFDVDYGVSVSLTFVGPVHAGGKVVEDGRIEIGFVFARCLLCLALMVGV